MRQSSKSQQQNGNGVFNPSAAFQLRSVNKDSHPINKQPVNKTTSSIRTPRNPTTKRQPVIIYTQPPPIIHTNARDFTALVQKLTGMEKDEKPVATKEVVKNEEEVTGRYQSYKSRLLVDPSLLGGERLLTEFQEQMAQICGDRTTEPFGGEVITEPFGGQGITEPSALDNTMVSNTNLPPFPESDFTPLDHLYNQFGSFDSPHPDSMILESPDIENFYLDEESCPIFNRFSC